VLASFRAQKDVFLRLMIRLDDTEYSLFVLDSIRRGLAAVPGHRSWKVTIEIVDT
jgi:hypothetical protein